VEGVNVVMSAAAPMETVLEIRGLRLNRGQRQVICGVDLGCGAARWWRSWASRSGKTTVLRALAGLETYGEGSIRVEKVGMVFQFHYLFEHLSALANVWLAPVHVLGVPRADAEARAQSLLDQIGVGHRAHALPRELSGGEAQRVAIARALAVDPPLLLLDEPTASLDPARQNELGKALRELSGQGRTLLFTSHDDDFVRDYATRVVVLAEGRVVEEGEPRQVLTRPKHEATRQLLQVEPARRRAKR
jgi:ABC-type polar amino acid transport system ATPase subunit